MNLCTFVTSAISRITRIAGGKMAAARLSGAGEPMQHAQSSRNELTTITLNQSNSSPIFNQISNPDTVININNIINMRPMCRLK
jgi:hypothetical protein